MELYSHVFFLLYVVYLHLCLSELFFIAMMEDPI